MMSPVIRFVAVCGWVAAVGMFAGNSGFAQTKADGASHDLPVTPCETYKNNTFLSDESVASRLRSTPRVALPPPCTENVTPANVDPSMNPKDGAAATTLNAFFNTGRTPLERLQNGFDLYSWLTFIALNLPQDQTVELGAHDDRTVWESNFLALDQVMNLREDTENFHLKSPSQQANLPKPCLDAQQKKGGAEPTMFVNVDDVAFDQPFKTGPLIDQKGHYSLNTIFMSPEMRNYLKNENNNLVSFAGQQVFQRAIEFPVGKAASAGAPVMFGSMMIKASWRELTASEDRNEFHTVKAYRYFPANDTCDLPILGLVGFHVVHKTEHRHQWIWTTFEHVRNVPSADDVKNGKLLSAYFFFNANAGRTNRTPEQPWDPLHPSPRKSQIVRAQDIPPDTQKINGAAHAFLTLLSEPKSDPLSKAKPTKDKKKPNLWWTHYQLISTQWPADFNCASEKDPQNNPMQINQQADPNCSPAPEFLPNSTLETYIQHDIGTSGGVPQSTSSCIACHNNAVAYLKVDYGDQRSLGHHGGPADLETECLKSVPSKGCSSASDFTFILEQVCAPMTDLRTGRPECKRDH